MKLARDCFRDLICFVVVMLVWQAMVATGYGQPLDEPSIAPATRAVSSPAGRGARPASARSTAAARATAQLGAPPKLLAQASPLPQGLSVDGLEAAAGMVKPAGAKARSSRKNVKPRTTPANVVTFGGPANSADPYIVAEAQALNNDANQIFAFVRDQIAFEVYAGSLRGARGTLWSKAGNSLDKSSLLIALLGAAGISARYVQGTISNTQQQQLILSMFSSPSRVTGCVPSAITRSNPASDPDLLADVGTHFWAEFGNSFTPADPSFAGTQIGQTIGSATQRFTSVPSSLETTVTVRLDVEMYEQAAALFGFSGGGLFTSEVENETFNTDELAGRPITAGNFVTSSSLSSILSSTTFTYSPYLRVSLDASNPAGDQVITGQEYQEVYTNFPFGTQILTGVFLYMDVASPGSQVETYQHNLLDRIGFAAREGLATASITPASPPMPALTDLDTVTLNALSGKQDTSILTTYQNVGTAMDASNQALQTQVAGVNLSAPSAAGQAVIQQGTNASRESVVLLSRVAVASFAALSDTDIGSYATAEFVKAYYSSPRLILFSTGLVMGTNSASVKLGMDLQKNDMQVLAPPGQATNAPFQFNILRGMSDNADERLVTQQILLQLPSGSTTSSISVIDVLQAASAQNIQLLAITSTNVGTLDPLTISADAKARITAAVTGGHVVLVPQSPVSLNGTPAIAWLDIDPVSGYTTGTLENGTHDIFSAAALEVINTILLITVAYGLAVVLGFGLGLVIGALIGILLIEVVRAISGVQGAAGAGLAAILLLVEAAFPFLFLFSTAGGLLGTFLAAFALGVLAGLAIVANLATTGGSMARPGSTALSSSSPVFAQSSTTSVLDIASNLGPPAGPATPGNVPGVSLSVVTNTLLTEPFDGTDLPLVFSALIQNTGPAADQFQLNITPPAGYSLELSLPSVTVPAGETGEIDFCLVPTGSLPAPGTSVSLSASVASTDQPSINNSESSSFNTPTVQAITLNASPASLSATPGNAAMTTLTIQAVGNASITTNLTSTTPSGVTLSGLISPVTLTPGQSIQEALTLTGGAGVPFGTTLPVEIVSSTGDPNRPPTAVIDFVVTSQDAQAANTGASNAAALGRTDIAATLSGLSGAINLALTSCSPAAQTEVVSYVNNLIQEMNAPFLASFASQLQTASAAISASSCSNLPAALAQLSSVLASLSMALSSPAAFPFNLTLQPNSAVAQPGQPTSFLVVLQNNSSTTNTYSLSLGSLPSGVTGSLSASSVTLAPGASIPVNNANNNPIVTITPSTGTAFQFSLNASINGVAGSTQTALGTITARNTFLAVQDVTATPGFTQSGGSVDVVTHIANVVNQNKTVQVVLVVNNSSSQQVLGPFTQTVALSVTSLLTTVDFGQIATTGLANGNYTLMVSVIDPATNMVVPGGTGTGSLLIGSPVSATLTVMPTTLAPGNATVTSTLAVTSTTGGGGGSSFNLLGSVATASSAQSVAVNGTTAYTCDSNEVTVINAANPANPTIAGTAFAGAINNAQDIYCDIQRGDLVMLADTGSSGLASTPSFLAFDLTNPLSPSLLASTPVNKSFFEAPYYQGNTAFFGTNVIFLSGGTITGQGGDVVSLDVTDFTNPAVIGTLEEPETQGPQYGGSFNVYGITPFSTTLAYATSTTSEGNTPQIGTGQLWVVNTANPSAMSLVTTVNVPGTIQLGGPLVQGNTAVAIGDTGGWRNPDVSVDAYTGNVVIAVFDLTNPQSPQLVANVPTTFLPSSTFGYGAAVIGPHQFLYGGVMDSSNNQYLMLVDTTSPQNPVITTYLVPAAIKVMKAAGTLLYAPSASGLQIYSIPGTSGAIQYTATVQVPTTGKVIYNPGSFSIAPAITHGTGVDTLTWTNPSSNTITWTSNVTGISPADVLPVDLGGTVNFTVTAGSGSITLPQVNINSGQILGLAPGMQTVAPGQLATYTLTVNNPTSAAITYNLAVTGVNPSWVAIAGSVTVAANGSANVPLNLQSTLADIAGTYSFTVTATSGGTSGAVEGAMILAGASGNIGAVGSSNTLGVSVALTPAQQTGGQGTPVMYTVQLTNVGNAADTYTLSASTPTGVTATFAQSSIAVPPGLSNFRQTLVTVTAARGLPAGALNFTITATSESNSQIQGAATGTLNLVSAGVSVSISPASVNPGGTLHLTVTNLGTASDTFNLALGGPAAIYSSLAASSVTLAAGQSQTISIAVGAAAGALGTLGLVATATSRANSGVSAAAQATVTIPASQSVSAAFNPMRTGLNAPGPATLLLQIQNTGTADDSYIAAITSTSGPITASLVDPVTGQSVQTSSVFVIPAAAQGQLVVHATLTGIADGSVTVKITSQTNGGVTATATGVVGLGTSVPVAIAGRNRNVPAGEYTSLDGGQSYDPSQNRLTYAWTIVSKPAGSALGTLNALFNAATPQPDFLPDVNGAYTLELIVNNGSVNSAPSMVTITAYTGAIPPNANAGMAANARRGTAALLNGTASNDPTQSGLALSYLWTVASAPGGSALNGAVIGATSQPSFTPDADGAFVIQLKVSDTDGAGTDTVTITAADPPVPPNAVAGANRRIVLNTPITVDGSGSNDPDNLALTYQWEFVSGSLNNSALMNPNGAQVAFAPVAPGFYVLRLNASDSAAASFAETTVLAAKYCDANADGVVNQVDFDLMTALIGTAAQPNDPLDPNGDGLITPADIAICKGQTATPAAQPNLYVSPAFLVFQYTKGGPLPAAQTLSISSDGTTQFTMPTFSFSWLNVNPQAAITPAGVSVSINPTGLAAGPYLAELTPVANGYNSPTPVRIELTVFDAPQFIIVPGALTFNYQLGQAAPAAQTISVGTSGEDANFSAAVSGAAWLSVNPNAALTPKPVVVTANPSPAMAPGTYTGTITFTSPSAPMASITVTLNVTPAPPVVNPASIVNAASDIGGAVAPGEIIYLGGTGFAQAGATLTPPASGPIPMELGTTQVFFDATAAPLLEVQPGLIEAIVPYEIAGHATTVMHVVYAGESSQMVTLPVEASNPGIFTTSPAGTGQMVAVNANGTVNSAANPAPRGSPITFYETGEGQTNPAGVDGSIAPLPPKNPPSPPPSLQVAQPLDPVPVLPVSVTIGGDNAVVNYAGGAPGYPAGLMQVNAVVPANAPTGGSVAVVIKVGTNQSQQNATIWVE